MQLGGEAKDTRPVFRRWAGQFRQVLRDGPRTPSLVSRTLEPQDVELARHWLDRTQEWADPAPVAAYEAAFAAWNGSAHAVSFGAGRVALSAIVEALGLGPGDRVVVPAFTCVVVPNAFTFRGVEVIFADIELETYGLCAEAFEATLAQRPSAVVLQHLFGLVARDTRAVLELARQHGVTVIEDCAHSTGARLGEQRVGTLGDVAFTSSEHSKIFTTVQGGLALTQDDALAARLRDVHARMPEPAPNAVATLLWNVVYDYHRHAAPDQRPARRLLAELEPLRLAPLGDDEAEGRAPLDYERRLAAPLAALGQSQLARVDGWNAQRRATAGRWDAWCMASGYDVPLVLHESTPVFLRYPVLVEPERKTDLAWAVRELGVTPGVWFVSSTHPVDRGVRGFPNADRAVAGCINLPTLL